MSSGESSGSGPERTSQPGRSAVGRWTIARWIAIAVLLLAALFVLAVLNFQVCEPSTVVSAKGSSCRAPNATDSVTLVFFALVAALLWPDVAEFGVFGFSVKRTAERALQTAGAAQHAAERAEDHFLVQSVRLEQISTNSASASSELHNYNFFGVEELRSAAENLPGKVRAFENGEPFQEGHPAKATPTDQRVGKLIRLWADLSERLSLESSSMMAPRRPQESRHVDDRRIDKDIFIETFLPELRLIRAVRNSAAHSRDVSADAVTEAISVAERLIRALDKDQL